MAMHSQSGCTWKDGEIKHVQLQHREEHGKKTQWWLNGIKKDGTVRSARVSRQVAEILLAQGISSGN